MSLGFELVLILLLIAGNGVFALAEIAVVTCRRESLEPAASGGSRAARRVLALKESPGRFLSTVQVGITLIGVLAGAFGGAAIAGRLAETLSAIPWLAEHAYGVSFAIVVGGVTYLSVVVGELVPKQMALSHPERWAKALAPPMAFISRVSAPLIWLLDSSSRAVLALLRVRPPVEQPPSEEEIRIILRRGAKAGVLKKGEQALLERVMEVADRRVASMMTPRTHIVWIDASAPVEEAIRTMSESAHSTFPVCEESIDRIIGVVSIKDLWRQFAANRDISNLREFLRPAPYVPESMPSLRVLEVFKESGRHLALVLDEYGGVSGLVTLHDWMEAMAGELPSEGDPAEQATVRRPDGSWLLDGLLPIEEAQRLLSIPTGADEGDYNTVAGMILARLGRFPRVGEHVEWAGYDLEIMDMDGFRVDRVLASQKRALQRRSDPKPRAD